MPLGMGFLFYSFSPQTRRVFATPEQQQLFEQLRAAIGAKGQTVFYLGMATIAIGIIVLIADRKKKP